MNSKELMKVKFSEWNCVANFDRYNSDNSVSIQLYDEETGEPIARATTCLHPLKAPEDCVFIKDHDENEGMARALIDAGVIHPGSVCTRQSGFSNFSAYQLTPQALKMVAESDLEFSQPKGSLSTSPSP